MLQIRNIRNQTNQIQENMVNYLHDLSFQENDSSFSGIRESVLYLKNEIEQLCNQHQGTPADLGTPTFRQYLWLRFLSNAKHLSLHLKALQSFDRMKKHHTSGRKNDLSLLQLRIEYCGYLYQRKTSHGKTALLINEGFINASDSIKQKLISAAYAKRKNKASDAIKSYATSDAYLKMGELIAGDPIANHLSCKGKYYNLDQMFQNLNWRYFKKKLPQPRLVWSSSRAKRRLGYYHPEIHTIAINKKFDAEDIPLLLIEYILFHEMLHQFFGIEHRNGRRFAHTPAFHQAEKTFRDYKEAENLIKLLH